MEVQGRLRDVGNRRVRKVPNLGLEQRRQIWARQGEDREQIVFPSAFF